MANTAQGSLSPARRGNLDAAALLLDAPGARGGARTGVSRSVLDVDQAGFHRGHRRQRDRHARGQATDSLGPRTVRASRDALRSLQLPDTGDGVARRGYPGCRDHAELLAPEPPNQVSVERVCGPEHPPRQSSGDELDGQLPAVAVRPQRQRTAIETRAWEVGEAHRRIRGDGDGAGAGNGGSGQHPHVCGSADPRLMSPQITSTIKSFWPLALADWGRRSCG